MNDPYIVFTDEPFLLPEFLMQAQTLENARVQIFRTPPANAQQIVERAHDADIIVVDVVSTYDASVLSQLPKLRYLISTSVATNHIDLLYCKRADIKVIVFPGFNARAVAEAAFTYIMALNRQLTSAWNNVLDGGWNSFRFNGVELGGKVLGIVGAGNIGKELIKIGRGLDMEVLCNTLNQNAERAKRLGIPKFSSKTELLRASDYVVLAIEATDQTSDFIAAEEFSLMKESSYLVSIGRSSLINVSDLADAIYERKIAGCASDLIAPEPYNLFNDDLRIQELINSPNMLAVPHIAWHTHEANLRLGASLLNELKLAIETLKAA